VIVLDANLLLYAFDGVSSEHNRARKWIESIFSGVDTVGLPWITAWAFVRVSTNPSLPGARFTAQEAADIVAGWMDLPQVTMLAPGERHWPLFRRMMIEGRVRGPQSTDAVLAALTIEWGGVLHTTDRGFARYPGLRFVNPLAGF
jgi:toxin-antitoxin system PIN domain toxin